MVNGVKVDAADIHRNDVKRSHRRRERNVDSSFSAYQQDLHSFFQMTATEMEYKCKRKVCFEQIIPFSMRGARTT